MVYETEILEPTSLTIPQMTTAVRNTIVGKIGLIIYDSTQNKLCFKKAAAAAAASWELITSVQEA
ncbi:MAG: hypothetical protein M0R35_07160 [Candidatus Omnitrophica bacterium]|nr:hypothetical protein [Candidatus Omnitrophota bacterium]